MRVVHVSKDYNSLRNEFRAYRDELGLGDFDIDHTNHTIIISDDFWFKFFVQDEFVKHSCGLRCDKVVLHRGVRDDLPWEPLLSEPHSLRIIERHL